MKFSNIAMDKIDRDVLSQFIGEKIVFGGHGIVDGLKAVGKADCYLLVDVKSDRLILKGYRLRRKSILKEFYWDQSCQIVTFRQ